MCVNLSHIPFIFTFLPQLTPFPLFPDQTGCWHCWVRRRERSQQPSFPVVNLLKSFIASTARISVLISRFVYIESLSTIIRECCSLYWYNLTTKFICRDGKFYVQIIINWIFIISLPIFIIYTIIHVFCTGGHRVPVLVGSCVPSAESSWKGQQSYYQLQAQGKCKFHPDVVAQKD